MAEYDANRFEAKVKRLGEVFVVLDSDREYIVHGTEGYELVEYVDFTEVRIEGMKDDEYVKAEFPLDAIEHVYTHKEV